MQSYLRDSLIKTAHVPIILMYFVLSPNRAKIYHVILSAPALDMRLAVIAWRKHLIRQLLPIALRDPII